MALALGGKLSLIWLRPIKSEQRVIVGKFHWQLGGHDYTCNKKTESYIGLVPELRTWVFII